MKKLREMKKNNKGFSLVELIVVIAIMVVLVAVLGSTILGYIDESKYSKDIQALDAIDTGMTLLVAEPGSDYTKATDADGCTLADLLTTTDGLDKKNKKLADTIVEIFDGTDFRNSSSAFSDVKMSTVYVKVTNGAVTITVKSNNPSEYPNYQSPEGSAPLAS